MNKLDEYKARLDRIMNELYLLGSDMAFYGNLQSEVVEKGRQLLGAVDVARGWLKEDWNV